VYWTRTPPFRGLGCSQFEEKPCQGTSFLTQKGGAAPKVGTGPGPAIKIENVLAIVPATIKRTLGSSFTKVPPQGINRPHGFPVWRIVSPCFLLPRAKETGPMQRHPNHERSSVLCWYGRMCHRAQELVHFADSTVPSPSKWKIHSESNQHQMMCFPWDSGSGDQKEQS